MVEEVYDDDGPSNLGHPLFDLMHQDFFLPTLYSLMGLREYKSWANYAMSCYGFSSFMPFVQDLRAKVLLAQEMERNAARAFVQTLSAVTTQPSFRVPRLDSESIGWMRMTESTSRHAFMYVFCSSFHESVLLLPSFTSPKRDAVSASMSWIHELRTYLAKMAMLAHGRKEVLNGGQPTRSIGNMADIVQQFGMSNSTCILGTIYFERFLRTLKNSHFLLVDSKWFPVFMCCMLLAAKVTEDSTHGLNWKLAEMLAKYEDIDSDSVLQMLNHLESLILETIDYNMAVPDDLKVEFEKQPAKVVHWLLAFLVYCGASDPALAEGSKPHMAYIKSVHRVPFMRDFLDRSVTFLNSQKELSQMDMESVFDNLKFSFEQLGWVSLRHAARYAWIVLVIYVATRVIWGIIYGYGCASNWACGVRMESTTVCILVGGSLVNMLFTKRLVSDIDSLRAWLVAATDISEMYTERPAPKGVAIEETEHVPRWESQVTESIMPFVDALRGRTLSAAESLKNSAKKRPSQTKTGLYANLKSSLYANLKETLFPFL